MSLLKDIWNAVSGIGKGMQKTYDEQFDPVFTNMYPFVQPDLPPVSVQSLALIQNEDGSDRCVSCLACEKVCPSQVITIERKRNPAGKGFVLERFDLDLVNCMYCAACVESCPAQAIVTIQDFELSTPNLQSLKADKAMLDAQGLRARQWYSPKVGVEYREEDPNNPVHGKIVKAPIEEQPGGLQEMEKARLAALNPAPAAAAPAPTAEASSAAPAAEAPKPAPVAPKAGAAPAAPAAEGEAPKNPKIKRFEPKTPAASSAAPPAEAPAASSAAAAPSPTPPVTETSSGAVSGEAKPANPKIKRFEPKTPAAPASSEPQGIASRPEPAAPAVSSPPVEAPKAEAPKAEPPAPTASLEPPKAETPSQVRMSPSGTVSSAPVEIPKTEIPKAEIPKAEIPKAAAPQPEPKPAEVAKPAETPASSAPTLPSVDDLTLIEGIGPKRAEALVAAGITTFKQLSQADRAKLESVMTGANLSLEPGIETWPVQAEFLVKGDMAGFKTYTDSLVAGRVKKNPKVKRWEPKS